MPKLVKPLTTTEITKSKPKDKDYSLSDGHGLFLFVRVTGSKIWRFQYYKPITKKRTIISLGSYPELSIADARGKRDEYRGLLAKNIDPQEHNLIIEQEALQEKENLFSTLAEKWFEFKHHEVKAGNLKQVTYDDIVDRVTRHLLPHFGHMELKNISAPLARNKLKYLEKEGKLDTLHRVIGYMSKIMTLGVNIGLLHSNPIANLSEGFLRPIAENNPTIPPEKLSEFFAALQSSKMSLEVRCAIELLLLTATRVGALTQMEWSEINFDEKLWYIPKNKMKGRVGKVQDFIAPLSKQALAVLAVMKKLTGNQKYVFTGFKNSNEPMNKETPNKAIKRMGYQNTLTAHGLRSIFSTAMNDAEFNPEIIEVCLAHFEYSSVRGAYNKAKYLTQRIEYMQWWGDFVEERARESAAMCLTVD